MQQPRLGLKENWKQFFLLVLVNAFVGGMVGMERSILPRLAEEEFQLSAKSAVLSFIVVFGFAKAITNYYTGVLANQWGRRKLLIAGWIIGLPVPFILMYSEQWSGIVAANILLGINQGLTWSSTVVMKIDLVGEKRRGLAMGLNEFAGYLAVALVAFFTGWMAAQWGVRPYPFFIGVVLSILGFVFSVFVIGDTQHHVMLEGENSTMPRLKNVFMDMSWRVKSLASITQAGFVNNLNDGMIWGILPIVLGIHGIGMTKIGYLTAIYPAVWGMGQLITGAMADRWNKPKMMFWGMMVQAIGLGILYFAKTEYMFGIVGVFLGAGTALVYPTFLASIAERTHPADRAQSLGVYRMWRDMGYAVGALLTGVIADLFSIGAAILFVAFITALSSLILKIGLKTDLLD